MGLLYMVAGFAAGIYLSWRQPTSASRGLLVVSGAIGAFYWLLLLTVSEQVEHSVWLWVDCFLWSFAVGNVARYAETGRNGGEPSMAEMETEEERPKTHPVLPLQAIVIVPTYWLASLAWWWLYQHRAEEVSDTATVAADTSILDGDALIEAPVWFGDSDQSLAMLSAVAICGLLAAWKFRHIAAPTSWQDFFGSYGMKAFHPVIVFAVLICGYMLAGVPANYFTRVKFDEHQIVWPSRKAYMFWESHRIAWDEISGIAIDEVKTGRSKYGDRYSPRLHFTLKHAQGITIYPSKNSSYDALEELRVRAKRRGIACTRAS